MSPELHPNPKDIAKRASRLFHNRERAQSDPKRRDTDTPMADTATGQPDPEQWAWSRFDRRQDEPFIELFLNEDNEENASDALRRLTETRTGLAEATVAARQGNLISNKKRESALEKATEDYNDARSAFAEEQLALLESRETTPDQRRALLDALAAKEDGALMGEEANIYLNRQNNPNKFQKLVERYNGLSTKNKFIVGAGATAVTAVVAGLTAGGAVAGAAVGTRFGRSYFTQEAKRRGQAKSELENQQMATLRTSNEDMYRTSRERHSGTPAYSTDSSWIEEFRQETQHRQIADNEAVASERSSETKGKRLAVAKAAGYVAVGTTIGAVLENGTGWRGIFRSEDIDSVREPQQLATPKVEEFEPKQAPEPAPSETPEILEPQDIEPEVTIEPAPEAEVPETDPGTESDGYDGGEAASESNENSASAEISERSKYLYGEFAGTEMNLTIPAGSNVWDQLELQVDAKHPNISFSEKQRLVGNLLNSLENQYPARNFDMVNAGEKFSFSVSSKA